MKRKRPHQHYRVIKTKKGRKRITINRGISKHKNKKNYGSGVNKLFRKHLENKHIDIIHSLQKFLRKEPEHIDVLKGDKDISNTFVFSDKSLSGKNLGRFSMAKLNTSKDYNTAVLRLNPQLFSKKEMGAKLPHVLKHEIGHLKDYKLDSKQFDKQAQRERKIIAQVNQCPEYENFAKSTLHLHLPHEVSADKYARRVPQRKLSQYPEYKKKAGQTFKAMFH